MMYQKINCFKDLSGPFMAGSLFVGVALGLSCNSKALIFNDPIHTIVNMTSWLLDEASQWEQYITQADHYINAVYNSAPVQAARRLRREYNQVMNKGRTWYWRINNLPNQIERLGDPNYVLNWAPPYDPDARRGILSGILRPQDVEQAAAGWDADARELERNVKTIEFLKEYDEKIDAQEEAVQENGDDAEFLLPERQEQAMQLNLTQNNLISQQLGQLQEINATQMSNQNNEQRRAMERVRLATEAMDARFQAMKDDTAFEDLM